MIAPVEMLQNEYVPAVVPALGVIAYVYVPPEP